MLETSQFRLAALGLKCSRELLDIDSILPAVFSSVLPRPMLLETVRSMIGAILVSFIL